MGQPGLAAMIILMMQIGQRPGDMRAVKWGDNFLGDRLVFRQSKTRKKLNLPIAVPFRELISSVRVEGSPFLFNDGDTGQGFTAAQLSRRFYEIRLALAEAGEEPLLLRSLRHSCVCRLLMNGQPPARVAAITGHSLFRLHGLIERYFIDRAGLADRALRADFVLQGNKAEDFGEVAPLEPYHWVFGDQRRREFKVPAFTERNFEYVLACRLGQNPRHLVYPRELINRLGAETVL